MTTGSKKEFKIRFDQDWFQKGEILKVASGAQVKVIKVYRMTWWKKTISWVLGLFGIEKQWILFRGVKVREL